MVNVTLIFTIFIIVIVIISVFIAQQFQTAKKISAQKPKTLLERMSAGGGALNTEKFRRIVMESGPQELQQGVQSLVDHPEGGALSHGVGGETPDEQIFAETIAGLEQPLFLEGKDLQTIYSEYLSAKNLKPFDVEPDFKLGVAYLKFGQFEKSQNQFLKVVDDKPDFPGIYYYLGEAYRCNGQFYEAMKSYKKSWEMETKVETSADRNKPGETDGEPELF